jgi:hypothetical protein
VIPAAIADSWLFRLAIIGVVAGVYILPTVIAIARQVEGLGWVICLNTIPVGWPAALILACLMPPKEVSHGSLPAAATRAGADAGAATPVR